VVAITDELRRLFFRYDHDLPLDSQGDPPVVLEGLRYQRALFTSTHGERVPAAIVRSAEDGPPRPVLIVQHGAGGGKDEPRMQTLMSTWARRGFLCVCTDSPLHGERGGLSLDPRTLLQRPYSGLDFIVQYVVDLMRTVDYLETRGDADAGRLGFAGFSLSTVLGVHFVALDERVRAASFAIGGAGLFHFLSGRLPAEQRADIMDAETVSDVIADMRAAECLPLGDCDSPEHDPSPQTIPPGQVGTVAVEDTVLDQPPSTPYFLMLPRDGDLYRWPEAQDQGHITGGLPYGEPFESPTFLGSVEGVLHEIAPHS